MSKWDLDIMTLYSNQVYSALTSMRTLIQENELSTIQNIPLNIFNSGLAQTDYGFNYHAAASGLRDTIKDGLNRELGLGDIGEKMIDIYNNSKFKEALEKGSQPIQDWNQMQVNDGAERADLEKNQKSLDSVKETIKLKEIEFKEKFPDANLETLRFDNDSGNFDESPIKHFADEKMGNNCLAMTAENVYKKSLMPMHEVKEYLEQSIHQTKIDLEKSDEIQTYLKENNGAISYLKGDEVVTLALTNSKGQYDPNGPHIMKESQKIGGNGFGDKDLNFIPRGHRNSIHLDSPEYIKQHTVETAYDKLNPEKLPGSVIKRTSSNDDPEIIGLLANAGCLKNEENINHSLDETDSNDMTSISDIT